MGEFSAVTVGDFWVDITIWILCLYFMGLNLSNLQIAKELDLNKDDVQQMTEALRKDVTVKKPEATLEGKAEIDEVYIVAGHKGNPEEVQEKLPHYLGLFEFVHNVRRRGKALLASLLNLLLN